MMQELKSQLDYYEEHGDYNTRIKVKLIRWKYFIEESLGNTPLNYSAISKALRDYDIDTSPQTISKMFDLQSISESVEHPGFFTTREIKLQDLAGICHLFNIPIGDICDLPRTSTSNLNPELFRKSSAQKTKKTLISSLNDSFYEGKYYCYYFDRQYDEHNYKPVESDEIEEGILTISQEKGHTVLTLEEVKQNKSFYGDTMPSFTLTGNLYHLEGSDIAYAFIRDNQPRRAMAIMFRYLNLSADIRWYITAGILTFTLNQIHNPLFEKMAIFKERQSYNDPDTAEIIRGILSLSTNPIILSEDTLERLKDNEDLREILSEKTALKKCLLFQESNVISNALLSGYDTNRAQKLLLHLRASSWNPACQVIHEDDSMTHFIRQFQIEQRDT